jgi:hypothetical protein
MQVVNRHQRNENTFRGDLAEGEDMWTSMELKPMWVAQVQAVTIIKALEDELVAKLPATQRQPANQLRHQSQHVLEERRIKVDDTVLLLLLLWQ